MEVCNLPRRYGKTTYLIYRSHVTQYPILCLNRRFVEEVKDMARKMKIGIPEPIVAEDLFNKKAEHNIVLVDEALLVLSNLLGVEIDTVTLSEREKDWLK